jgi:hypothetical protein
VASATFRRFAQRKIRGISRMDRFTRSNRRKVDHGYRPIPTCCIANGVLPGKFYVGMPLRKNPPRT